MNENQSPESEVVTAATPPASRLLLRRLAWPLGLFGLAFLIRLVYALQVPFPSLDDPAYYVQGARSLRQGTFFEMGITWNYAFKFNSVVRPGFDFWTPLAAFLIATSFTLFGDNPLAAQLPSIVGGAVLASLGYYLARRIFEPLASEWGSRRRELIAGLVGLYIALNPFLSFQSVTPDSMMIFAPLATGAILVYLRKLPGRPAALAFGLLAGFAYLARTHALFLVAAWVIIMLWRIYSDKPNRRRHLENSGLVFGGLAVTVLPWMLRNFFTFGSFASPSTTESIFMYQFPSFYNYETPINFQSFLASGLDKIVGIRMEALRNSFSDVLGGLFFPLGFLPIVGLLLLWRRTKELSITLVYGFLTVVVFPLVFSVVSSTGSLYHSIGSLGAVGAVGLFYLLWWLSHKLKINGMQFPGLFPVLVGLFLVLEIVQFAVSTPDAINTQRQEQARFTRLKTWLAANNPGKVVISDEPSTFNYATGIPALRLPADESLEVVQRLAKKYGAKYIVVTSNFGRYPDLLLSPENKLFPRVYKDNVAGEFEVYLVP